MYDNDTGNTTQSIERGGESMEGFIDLRLTTSMTIISKDKEKKFKEIVEEIDNGLIHSLSFSIKTNSGTYELKVHDHNIESINIIE